MPDRYATGSRMCTIRTLPSSSGETVSRQYSIRTMSPGSRARPSEQRKPAASSKSWPGVRMVTASVSRPTRISSGSSTVTESTRGSGSTP